MSKVINLFTDFGFKRIFGQEESKSLLIGFLNSLFEGEYVFKDLVYRDKERLPEDAEGRTVIYDIFCTLDDGRHFIVEMQNKNHVNFGDRALYYVAKAIVVQAKKGGSWPYAYAPVVGVYFMNFKQSDFGRAYRVDFGVTKIREMFASEEAESEHTKMLREVLKDSVSNKIRMIFLQLPEFTKSESECQTNLDK